MAILPPLALIAGPTASGKSALAIALAERSNGVIVNADSAQVYRDLPILSAAPTKADRKRADHRLYGFMDGADPGSAANWAKAAKAEIDEIQASQRLPILVGGTGMYIRTLLDGIAPVPPIDPAIRNDVRSSALDHNRARLLDLDPEAAERLGPADTARIARALEVVMATGKTLSTWQKDRRGGIGDSSSLHPLVLLPPRAWLYERCNARFAAMLDSGAQEEVAALLRRNLSPDLPVMRAIGVETIAALNEGRLSRPEALIQGGQVTRNYAKRQYTWFNHQPPADWPRFTEPLDAKGATARALDLFAIAA